MKYGLPPEILIYERNSVESRQLTKDFHMGKDIERKQAAAA